MNYPNWPGYQQWTLKLIIEFYEVVATAQPLKYLPANIFNNLPMQIRENYNYNSFVNASKHFYAERAFDRICNV